MRNLRGYAAALLLVTPACTVGSQTVVDAPADSVTGADPELDAGAPAPAPELDAGRRPSYLDFDAGPDAGEPPPADVEVVITTDNAFSFGYGDADAVTTFMQGVPSGAGEIFDCPVDYGPEPFVVPGEQAPEDAYLYIVAWADRDWTQGALAQFRRAGSSALYSGAAEWEVCATGVEYDGLGNGPDQSVVNQYIAECGKGAEGATYSKGWVDRDGPVSPGAIGKLAVGEANDSPAGDFPVVCHGDGAGASGDASVFGDASVLGDARLSGAAGAASDAGLWRDAAASVPPSEGVAGLDPEAKWMWFDPQDGASPFVGNLENRTKAFLIFRLPAAVLVEVF